MGNGVPIPDSRFPAPAPMPFYLTRRVSFAAAHRYRLPQWSDERNAQVFGLCARPNYHGHSYVCEVTVRGELDETTGMIVDLARVDEVLAVEVRERFDHRNINLDVPEFADGGLVPTGENLARFIFERVQHALGRVATVTAVTIAEDDSLRVTYDRGG
jgi:6-pyruvoyltetrahydropterin/6-carboxytetrahydropterin synthase